mgnify:CR=1 FL=1
MQKPALQPEIPFAMRVFYFSVRSARLALKNRRRIAVHSSHSNPRYNSGLKAFFERRHRHSRAARTHSFVFRAEHDAVHAGVYRRARTHGTRLQRHIQRTAGQPPGASTFAACSIASSSAWPSTLRCSSRRFRPRPMTLSSFTTTAPTGTSPAEKASSASESASRMNFSSGTNARLFHGIIRHISPYEYSVTIHMTTNSTK